jgi:hypothetical protein
MPVSDKSVRSATFTRRGAADAVPVSPIGPVPTFSFLIRLDRLIDATA